MEMLSFGCWKEGITCPFLKRKLWKCIGILLKPDWSILLYFRDEVVFCVYEILYLCMYDNNGISSHLLGFPGDSDSKDPTCNTGDPGSIFALERSPRRGNGWQLQYPCLENSMDRGV